MPAGRPKGTGGVRLTDAHRDKIRKSNILNALMEHVEGKREMTATQVTAGLGLLRKALPDLSSVALTDPTGEGPAQIVFKTVYEERSGN